MSKSTDMAGAYYHTHNVYKESITLPWLNGELNMFFCFYEINHFFVQMLRKFISTRRGQDETRVKKMYNVLGVK